MSIETENGTILKVIATFPEGANIQEITEALTISLEPRTLQRRLKSLTDTGQLHFSGDTRARRYFLPADLMLSLQTSPSIIPLSTKGKVIRSNITQDIKKRIAVEYRREFLEAYQPKITHYLSEKERELLLEMGTPFASQQTSGTFVKNILKHLFRTYVKPIETDGFFNFAIR